MKTFDEYKDFFLKNYGDLDKIVHPKNADGKKLLGGPDIKHMVSLYKLEKIRKEASDDKFLLQQIDQGFGGTVNDKGKRRCWFQYETFEEAYARYQKMQIV